jgi:uncharacterized protein
MLTHPSSRPSNVEYAFQGYLDAYLRGVSEQWLKIAPSANPGMLEMFRDRDRLPYRDLVPWAGEFAGKYLTAGVRVWELVGYDEELKQALDQVVVELISLQAADGYLGPWPLEYGLSGKAPQYPNGGTWDAWGHYHIMLGLLLRGGDKALQCARRIADLFCDKFLGEKSPRLVDTGSTEMNLAPIHTLCLLYKQTNEERYLDLALQIADEFAATDVEGKFLAGDYLNQALAGKEFFEMPKPRWESLHPIMGMVELYYITGDERYRQAFEHIWWSIVKLDRHNNGGFSSGEQAQGNPYHPGAIETCCTIAWIAMSVEMLRLTGNSVVAAELELSTLNSVVGLHSVSGRWVTYNTPMDGMRKASAHEIVFQSREGTPELNCCSVNGARGFGMISDWALTEDVEAVILNWYGAGRLAFGLSEDRHFMFEQKTDYPRSGSIALRLSPHLVGDTSLTLKFRIPYWSANTQVSVNGQPVENVQAGTYLAVQREWQQDDTIQIDLDMSLHYWVGEQECEGKTSIYYGPILLTYDRRFNDFDPDDIPALDAKGLHGEIIKWNGWMKPILLMEFTAVDGRKLRLCDFGSAGEGGSPYRSWLVVHNVEKTPFSRENPLRSGRV